MSLETLNMAALDYANRYMRLNILGRKVRCPYFQNYAMSNVFRLLKSHGCPSGVIRNLAAEFNNQEFNFGWYKGKGTPEEIERAFATITSVETESAYFLNCTEETVRTYLVYRGLGIDCSGFVFNVLLSVADKANLRSYFIDSLDWSVYDFRGDTLMKKAASNAGVLVFGGKASTLVQPKNLRPLDIVLLRGLSGEYNHIGIIIKSGELLKIYQSTPLYSPSGVSYFPIQKNGFAIEFGDQTEYFRIWAKQLKDKRIEFRRLKFLAAID